MATENYDLLKVFDLALCAHALPVAYEAAVCSTGPNEALIDAQFQRLVDELDDAAPAEREVAAADVLAAFALECQSCLEELGDNFQERGVRAEHAAKVSPRQFRQWCRQEWASITKMKRLAHRLQKALLGLPKTRDTAVERGAAAGRLIAAVVADQMHWDRAGLRPCCREVERFSSRLPKLTAEAVTKETTCLQNVVSGKQRADVIDILDAAWAIATLLRDSLGMRLMTQKQLYGAAKRNGWKDLQTESAFVKWLYTIEPDVRGGTGPGRPHLYDLDRIKALWRDARS